MNEGTTVLRNTQSSFEFDSTDNSTVLRKVSADPPLSPSSSLESPTRVPKLNLSTSLSAMYPRTLLVYPKPFSCSNGVVSFAASQLYNSPRRIFLFLSFPFLFSINPIAINEELSALLASIDTLCPFVIHWRARTQQHTVLHTQIFVMRILFVRNALCYHFVGRILYATMHKYLDRLFFAFTLL